MSETYISYYQNGIGTSIIHPILSIYIVLCQKLWILVTLYIHTGYTLSCTDFFLLLDWYSCPVEQSPSFHFSCPGSVSSYTGHVPSSYMECPEFSSPLPPRLVFPLHSSPPLGDYCQGERMTSWRVWLHPIHRVGSLI